MRAESRNWSEGLEEMGIWGKFGEELGKKKEEMREGEENWGERTLLIFFVSHLSFRLFHIYLPT